MFKSQEQERLFNFIKRHSGEAIPQELLYTGYQTDKNKYGQTPLIYWIEERRGEDIPQELYYPNY